MPRQTATLIGLGAIALWALLALLTDASGAVPPFQLAAMTFAVGGLAGLVETVRRGRLSSLRQPSKIWALGVGGLFGYHVLYFSALRNAPAVDASLIAFLWPLLIVLGATYATGKPLRAHHFLGALLGFLGAALLVTRGHGLTLNPAYAAGYAYAFAAAFFWSGYSILSGRVAHVPTEAVTGFCLVTALLAFFCHLGTETTVWPADTTQWLAVLGLGLGPVGLAFFLWDIGMKHGDMPVLGAASYGAPLFSTLILVAAGAAPLSWTIAAACLFISAGATIAAASMFAPLFRR